MSTAPPPSAPLVKLGVAVLLLGGVAGAWELWALQAPGSALYVGVLPGPVRMLRELCTDLGLVLLGSGLALGYLQAPAPGPWLRAMLFGGTALCLGASFYAAATGSHGVQASDVRADAPFVFGLKYGGLALVLGCLGRLGLGVLRR